MLSVKLCFYLVVFVGVNGWTALMPPQDKPAKYEHLDGCYLPQYDRVIENGEDYYPINRECVKYTCLGDINLQGCGAVLTSSNCHIVEGNLTLPYPKCCQSLRCEDKDGTDFISDFDLHNSF